VISLITKIFSFIAAKCKNALGMESYDIKDSQITASSAHDIGNVGPQHARYVFTPHKFIIHPAPPS
jgi:discoidin domain receptor family protein 2